MSFIHSCADGELPQCEVNGSLILVNDDGKYLGFWWKSDLMSSQSVVEENNCKVQRSFFHYGAIGAFQGDLNPLSSRSIIEMCVLPVLLYSCENCLLNHDNLHQLERFLGELFKRVLTQLLSLLLELTPLGHRKPGFLQGKLAKEAEGVGALAEVYGGRC